jgi:hypothetical protein
MRYARIGVAAVALTAVLWVGVQIHAAAVVDGQQYVGGWNGTWEGGGSGGKFDMTLEVSADGKLGGGVAVGTDQGDYTAKFSKLSFAGNKMTATYDYPLDAQGEVSITGTFDGGAATGTWGLGAKGQSQNPAMASGTWKIDKK